MNCKPGDLAIHKGGKCSENEGRLVVVRRFLGKVAGWQGMDRWEVGGEIVYDDGSTGSHARDIYLHPITPPPGEVTTEEVDSLFNPAPVQKVEA